MFSLAEVLLTKTATLNQCSPIIDAFFKNVSDCYGEVSCEETFIKHSLVSSVGAL